MKQKQINYTYWNAAVRVSEGVNRTRNAIHGFLDYYKFNELFGYDTDEEVSWYLHELFDSGIESLRPFHITRLLLMHEITNNPQD